MTMITTALLLATIASPQSHGLLLETEPVFVEVTSGRGSLLAGEATKPLASRDGEQWVDGRGHLSLVANSKAELRWLGRASVVLYGPCDFEWQPASPDEPLKWSLKELRHASIEIRQNEAELQLGDSWKASFHAGALELKSLPGNGYEIFQQAGNIATYQWSNASALTRPEQRGLIGLPVRLIDQPTPSKEDLSVHLEGRSAWSWPWRTESETSSDWQRSDWPWTAARPSPTTISFIVKPKVAVEEPKISQEILVELQPEESEAPSEPVTEVVVELPAKEELVKATEEPTLIAQEGGEGTWGTQDVHAESKDPWRGPDQSDYERFGEYYIQKGRGIDAWQLPDGSVRFSLAEGYTGGGWVLGPRLDTRINPGGSVEFRPNGALKNHSGAVRMLAAIER